MNVARQARSLPDLILSTSQIGQIASEIGTQCAFNPITGHLPPRLANVTT